MRHAAAAFHELMLGVSAASSPHSKLVLRATAGCLPLLVVLPAGALAEPGAAVMRWCAAHWRNKLAEAAYDHQASDAAYKKALVRILDARMQLCCKAPSQQHKRVCFRITEARDLNFVNMYCEKYQATMNAHDWAVVAKIKSERMPRLELCEADLDSLSNELVHALVCVLANSADDAALKRPAMRYFEAMRYSMPFRRGMLYTLAKHPPPAATNAACCPRLPREKRKAAAAKSKLAGSATKKRRTATKKRRAATKKRKAASKKSKTASKIAHAASSAAAAAEAAAGTCAGSSEAHAAAAA
ncbi:hypothetical protein COO60DRAFT_1642047 [Scenedesmus sp. NREL 46B-D3]|nr:hypothetical protein COO60DRAFT_1642047 [Scenedesmus sp. NREL 46B-D3]